MRSEPSTDLSHAGGHDHGCSECVSEMEGIPFPEPDSPDREAWEHIHARYHAARDEADALRGELGDHRVSLASYEGLFRISPFPIMEQDYTQIESWMADLRAEGVSDIREKLATIEDLKSIVSLIWIVAANPAAVRAVGLPLDELIGPIDPRIVNDDSYPSWISQFEAVWNRKPQARATFVAGRPDGQTYDAESTLAAPVVDGEPDFSRAMFTVNDISQHRSEERRMEELVDTKNQFLAAISHEIRTPLTAIVGFSQMMEDDEDMSDEDRILMVTSIVEQAREMSDLVNDLLVAARVEAGQVNIDAKRIDLADQVDQTLAAGGSFTNSVEFNRPEQSVMATADPGRVRQILRNLLTNAERYGGPNVTVSVDADESWVAVGVIDDGPGLPQDEWESIFQLYHQAHDGTSDHEGVGIGLAVSRQLAELMGGSLDYSREGDRSVFRLRLPADTPD